MFNYKVATTCIPNRETNEIKELPMNTPVKEMIQEAWKDYKFRTVIGIAKDGRPILSPFKEGGKPYTDCEVDVCNGIKVGEHYMYATTLFHPYVMGCFGPGGESNKLYQECSANPRLCDVKYEGIKTKANTGRKSETNATSAQKLLIQWSHSFIVFVMLGVTSIFY